LQRMPNESKVIGESDADADSFGNRNVSLMPADAASGYCGAKGHPPGTGKPVCPGGNQTMNKLVLGSVLVVAAFAGQASAGARDYFTEFVKDFGTTPRGPVLTHYFAIKNTTNAQVTIGQPRVSCGCVSTNLLKSTLAPGETTAVLAMMDTRRIPQAGVLKAVTVYVPFLSPTLEEVSLQVQTITRDDLVMTPESLAFGTVRQGQAGTASMKVTFYSDPGWKVTEAASTGIYVKPTVAEVSRKGNEVTYEVTATLDPACPVGVWSADVWLTTSNAAVQKLRVPVSVSVVAPIAVNPTAVSLADLKVGASVEHKVILRGNQAFKVLDVKGGDDVVSVKQQSEGSEAVHILTFAVSPKAVGDLTRMFEVTTDHKQQAKVSIPFKASVMK
jgi:hypothetical protein